jgi:mono/diheme cytochrome c family protein
MIAPRAGHTWLRLLGLASVAYAALVAGLAQCAAPGPRSSVSEAAPPDPHTAAIAAWDVMYGVLMHPRCVNCHPAGDAPLQGDDRRPHGQDVRRGSDGRGMFALRCASCHQTANLPGPNLPPGAPVWHLPHPDMPLVFEGMSRGDLCRQMRDPLRNGGKTPQQILHHVADDALVLWGWDPGPGRTPVSTPHEEFVRATRTWVENGCACPE